MEFWPLLMVASMPISQILLVGLLGAFLASGYINILSTDALRHVNKLVYVVFAPALIFASLAKTVTFKDILTWWFMPVNIGITFLIGGILGRMTVKILRLEDHLQGVVIATCSAGNLGSLLLILIPAICSQKGNPFEDPATCNAHGLSYVTFSMALGGIFIWTISYSQMKKSAVLYAISRRLRNAQSGRGYIDQETMQLTASEPSASSPEYQAVMPLLDSTREFNDRESHLWEKLKDNLLKVIEELLSPPTIAAIIGLFVGSIPWLKSSFIGSAAPLKLIQDSVTLLGDGTLPCVTLILGGNLTQGLGKSQMKPLVIMAIIVVRYVVLPLSGIAIVKGAGELGFLPESPLYRFVLLIQFTLPPAMGIVADRRGGNDKCSGAGTMAQLFDAGQEELSVIFMWTYLIAAVALTVWSMVFMWILS